MLWLDYMGHPFFDTGLGATVAYVDKDSPADLTEDDLYKVADFIETYYTQPALKDKPERRQEYARLVAKNFGSETLKSEEVCVFTGHPALGHSLSLKKDKEGREELPPGRAYRQHIPLITGEGIINFSAGG